MAFNKLDKTTLNAITSLHDKPNKQDNLDATALKKKFTDNAETIADFINNLIDLFAGGNTTTEYGSGARNVGVASRTEFSTYTNVEDVLLYLRQLVDTAQTGELVDNSIRENMLNHTTGYEAVSTDVIRNGAVTNSKLAGNITSDKILSVLTSVLVGTISNSQLAGGITYDKLSGSIRSSQLYGDIPLSKLSSGYNIPIANGGTGATTAESARTNLGVNRTNLGVTEQGKLKIGSTEYTLQTASSESAIASNKITFII